MTTRVSPGITLKNATGASILTEVPEKQSDATPFTRNKQGGIAREQRTNESFGGNRRDCYSLEIRYLYVVDKMLATNEYFVDVCN